MKTNSFEKLSIVPEDQWLAARRELLREEKELTRMHDRIAARRRELPWMKVGKEYAFDSSTYTILDLMPKGRDEEPTKFYKMDWVRHHDRYDLPTTDAVAAH